MKIRTAVAAAAVAASALTAGVGVGIASAAGTPLFQTSQRTENLVSPRCYHVHQVTRSYFHWSTKAGRYVAYPSAHQTITDYTHCHA